MLRTSLLILIAAGCRPDYTSPDEACTERLRGDAADSNGLYEGAGRVNCYRRLVGLEEVGTDARLQAAVDAHLDYMIVNETTDDAEDPADPGFTGEDTFARFEANGLPTVNVGAWPIAVEIEDETPAALIDEWMVDPWVRQAVLQPGMVAFGVGLKQGYAHALGLYTWPTREATRSPAVYPADGQIDVPLQIVTPLSMMSDLGLPEGVELGFPITMTVGSFSTEFAGEDPYGITISDARFEGPDGELPVHLLLPGEGDLPLLFGVIAAPEEPLLPSTTYTFTARLQWVEGDADVETTFTTAAE